jgi:hypothetical protein
MSNMIEKKNDGIGYKRRGEVTEGRAGCLGALDLERLSSQWLSLDVAAPVSGRCSGLHSERSALERCLAHGADWSMLLVEAVVSGAFVICLWSRADQS